MDLYLLLPDGRVVEKLDVSAGMPMLVTGMGTMENGDLALRTEQGAQRLDPDSLERTHVEHDMV